MDLFTDLSADFSIFIRLYHISFLILSSWNTKGNVHCVIKPIWMSYSLQKGSSKTEVRLRHSLLPNSRVLRSAVAALTGLSRGADAARFAA